MKPMLATTLKVNMHDDSTVDYTDVGYFLQAGGLDIVDPATGDHVARYRFEEFNGYHGTLLAGPAA